MAEGLKSKIATVQKRACGFRNRDHFKIAVYFHCGALDLYPALVTHRKARCIANVFLVLLSRFSFRVGLLFGFFLPRTYNASR